MEAPERRSTIGLIGALLGLTFAVGLWAARFFGEKSPVHAAEWWIGDVALASVFALPALVGVLAHRGRGGLWLTAEILTLVLSVTPISIATLVLVMPSVMYLVAYGGSDKSRGRPAVFTPLTLVVALSAMALLVFTPNYIVCWRQTEYASGRKVLVRDRASERSSRDGSFTSHSGPPVAGVVSEESGCTDGAIPPSRSLAALGLVGSALAATWRIT